MTLSPTELAVYCPVAYWEVPVTLSPGTANIVFAGADETSDWDGFFVQATADPYVSLADLSDFSQAIVAPWSTTAFELDSIPAPDGSFPLAAIHWLDALLDGYDLEWRAVSVRLSGPAASFGFLPGFFNAGGAITHAGGDVTYNTAWLKVDSPMTCAAFSARTTTLRPYLTPSGLTAATTCVSGTIEFRWVPAGAPATNDCTYRAGRFDPFQVLSCVYTPPGPGGGLSFTLPTTSCGLLGSTSWDDLVAAATLAGFPIETTIAGSPVFPTISSPSDPFWGGFSPGCVFSGYLRHHPCSGGAVGGTGIRASVGRS